VTAQPVKFRLYPDGRYRYVLVRIWPDRESMQAQFRAMHKVGERYDNAAALHSPLSRWRFRKGHPKRKDGIFAEIDCYQPGVDAEIASHEIGHATIEWARIIGIDPLALQTVKGKGEPEDNERFCYALGSMVLQFTRHAIRFGVWGNRKAAQAARKSAVAPKCMRTRN